MNQRAVPPTLLIMLPASVALLVAAMFVDPPPAPERVRWLDPAQAAAVDADRLRLLDFSADWCEPCRKMKRTTFRDAELARLIEESFVPVRYEEADGEQSPAMKDAAKELAVESFPTLVVVDRQRRVRLRLEGYRSAEQLGAGLRHVLDKKERSIDWYTLPSPALDDDPLPRLYFFAAWGCLPCDEAERYLKSRRFEDEFAGKFAFVWVDGSYSFENGRRLPVPEIRRLDVRAVPTLVVSAPDGRVVRRLVGFDGDADLAAGLREALANVAAPVAPSAPPTAR